MKKMLIAAAFALAALAGCASMQSSSPEAQIVTGANSLTAATTVAEVALRNKAITVTQAKQAHAVLAAAGGALDDANTVLVKCRADTKSTSTTSPDPCVPSTVGLITMAIESIGSAKRMLDAAK